MKQILITQDIKNKVQEYADNLFLDKSGSFVQPIEGLENLQTDIVELNSSLINKCRYVEYLEKIVDEFDELKSLLPSKFEKYKEDFDKLLPPTLLSTTIECRKPRLPKDATRSTLPVRISTFYEEVVARMHYKEARLVMASIMQQLDIQTCVYCNNNEAVYSEKDEEAYFHFDHWKPKDKYPFLCICFYNLYPSCSNCNGHKLDGEKGSFQLYAEREPVNDPFVFRVDMSKYEARNPQTLSVIFKYRDKKDEEYCKEFNEVFRINNFYNSPGSLRKISKLLIDIDKYRGSYAEATNRSVQGIVARDSFFHDVLGVDADMENIFTDIKKKLKIDTAKDANLL